MDKNNNAYDGRSISQDFRVPFTFENVAKVQLEWACVNSLPQSVCVCVMGPAGIPSSSISLSDRKLCLVFNLRQFLKHPTISALENYLLHELVSESICASNPVE